MEISWAELKIVLDSRNLNAQFVIIGNRYWIKAIDGNFDVECFVSLDPNDADTIDFETNYKSSSNLPSKQEVVTQYEINNKDLRTFWAMAETDVNGEAEICVQIPEDGRWIAYGDTEFKVRHFGDHIKILEVTDLDRLIAWQIALAIDPEAIEPVSDETVQASGYPRYPCVGHFDERDLVSTPNSKGTILGGMSMTFQYGVTEQAPVGGYAWVPGLFYFRIVGKKVVGQTVGHSLQVSIDWAQNA